MPAAGGAWDAVEVHIFPEAMRGTGMGDRPFDYKPKSTMTNGTVKAGGGSDAVGAVAKMQGPTITIDYKDGVKDVRLTPDTVIVSYAPGSKDELKSGAKIFIPAATRQRGWQPDDGARQCRPWCDATDVIRLRAASARAPSRAR